MDGRLFPTESPKNRGLKWMASFSLANLLKIGVKATSLVIVGPPNFGLNIGLTYFIPKLELPPEPLLNHGLRDNKLG